MTVVDAEALLGPNRETGAVLVEGEVEHLVFGGLVGQGVLSLQFNLLLGFHELTIIY